MTTPDNGGPRARDDKRDARPEPQPEPRIIGVRLDPRVRIGSDYIDGASVAAGYAVERLGAWVRITHLRTGSRCDVHGSRCTIDLEPVEPVRPAMPA